MYPRLRRTTAYQLLIDGRFVRVRTANYTHVGRKQNLKVPSCWCPREKEKCFCRRRAFRISSRHGRKEQAYLHWLFISNVVCRWTRWRCKQRNHSPPMRPPEETRRRNEVVSGKHPLSLHTLPAEIVYHILDELDVLTILTSVRNVCTRLNSITDEYHRYKVSVGSTCEFENRQELCLDVYETESHS